MCLKEENNFAKWNFYLTLTKTLFKHNPIFLNYRWDKDEYLDELFNETKSSGGSASEKNKKLVKRVYYCLKIATSLIIFLVVLASACISKGAMFFMIAQIARPGNLTNLTHVESTGRPLEYCSANIYDDDARNDTTYLVEFAETQPIAWMW